MFPLQYLDNTPLAKSLAVRVAVFCVEGSQTT